MKLARTKNTIRNTVWGLVYRIVTLIGPFIVKTILIKVMGVEYNGLTSLFTSILTVLNLANLGFSSSLVFTMYKAVESDDTDFLCALLGFFRKVYKYVGLAILVLGLLIMPFLPYLINGTYPPGINLYIIFSIYLIETSLGYLLFSYNIALFEAYQRTDITLKISTIRFIIQYIIQALVLIVFKNYYLYILTLPLMVVPNNIAVYKAARTVFPQIVCRGEISKEVKKDIYNRVLTLFGHKVGSTVLVSIDSVIISSFLNLTVLSIYSNYYYILTAVNGIIEIVTNGAIAGIGNKLLMDSKEENHQLFKALNYGWIALVGYASSFMLCLYQPFIGGVWLGKEYLLSNTLMVLIVVYFFSWMFRIMQLTYRDAAGLWTKDWLKPYLGMIVNLIGSIIMVKRTNSVAGVLIPTIVVFLLIYFPWEAETLYKYLFSLSTKKYYILTLFYALISLVGCIGSYSLCMIISPNNTWYSLIIRFFISFVVYPIPWLLLTRQSLEFKRLKMLIKSYIKKMISL